MLYFDKTLSSEILAISFSKKARKYCIFRFKTDILRSLFYLAEKGDEVNINKLFDILRNQKLIVMSNSFLGPLVKVHLVKGMVLF